MRQRQFTPDYGYITDAPAQYFGKIITVGDSIMAQNVSNTTVGGSTVEPIHKAQIGFINWMQALTGNGFSYRNQNVNITTPYGGDNFAVSGEAFVDVVGRLRSAFAQNGDIYYFGFGTNDITASRTAENIIDSYRFCIRECVSRGKKAWFNTIFPRNNDDGADFTSGQDAIRLTVNTALKAMEQEFKGIVTVFDADTALMDSATGKAISAYFTDGLHPNTTGAYQFALNVMLPKLAPFYAFQKIKATFPENYVVTVNPYGNLAPNSTYTGTGGAVGTGFSGTVPDSYTTARTDGTSVTSVVSIVSQANWNGVAANFVKFVCSATGAGADNETHRIAPTSSITTGVAIGQWVVAEVEVLVDPILSGSNVLRSIYIELRDNGTNGPVSRHFNVGYTDGAVKDYFPDGSYRLMLRTNPIYVRTTTGLVLRMNADIDGTLTGSRAVYFGRPVVRDIREVEKDGARVVVEANVAVAASPNLLQTAECGKVFTNEGATAANYHTLPTAVAGLTYGPFFVQDADGMRIVANSGDTVRLGTSVSAAAGYCESTTIGSSVTLVCINATEWVASSITGTWSVV